MDRVGFFENYILVRMFLLRMEEIDEFTNERYLAGYRNVFFYTFEEEYECVKEILWLV